MLTDEDTEEASVVTLNRMGSTTSRERMYFLRLTPATYLDIFVVITIHLFGSVGFAQSVCLITQYFT